MKHANAPGKKQKREETQPKPAGEDAATTSDISPEQGLLSPNFASAKALRQVTITDPKKLGPNNIIALQRTVGNQAVLGLLGKSPQSKSGSAKVTSVKPLQNRFTPIQRIQQEQKGLATIKPQLAQIPSSHSVIERVKKKLNEAEVEVEELDNWGPVALDSDEAVPPTAKFWKRMGYDGAWVEDTIFYTVGPDHSKLISISPAKINAYWDEKYLNSGFSRISGPDWRKNCADHATGETFPEVDEAVTSLAQSWTNKGQYNGAQSLHNVIKTLQPGSYVAQVGVQNFHFIRLTLHGEAVKLSQKDGESGVYEASMSKEAAAQYITGKAAAGIIYSKKS